MKKLFFFGFWILVLAAIGTFRTQPEAKSDVPILYWTVSRNEVTLERIAQFHAWLVKYGHVTKDGRPSFELRIDPSLSDGSKRMIHGVSGVASDLVHGTMGYFSKCGMLMDITEVAKAQGFSEEATYEAGRPDLTVLDVQYGFPQGVYSPILWVNVDTFAKYGMEPPPRYWNYKEFEAIGVEFVSRANRPGDPLRVFFLDDFGQSNNFRFMRAMWRDQGLDDYNETMTRCTLDDPRFAEVLRRVYRWTHELRLMPTAADLASATAEGGFGGTNLPLFHQGRFAMINSSRSALIRLREYAAPPLLSVSFYPFDDFINTTVIAQTVGVYELSRHKDLALLFLKFLTSREHNENMIENPSALPPVPGHTETEAYLRPPDHPNEWAVHKAEALAAREFSIARPQGPYIPLNPQNRIEKDGLERVMNNLLTPEEAAKWVAQRINRELAHNVAESERLKKVYDQDLKLQEKIDRYRSEGRKVPLSWIRNPYHRRYYVFKGWADSEGMETTPWHVPPSS